MSSSSRVSGGGPTEARRGGEPAVRGKDGLQLSIALSALAEMPVSDTLGRLPQAKTEMAPLALNMIDARALILDDADGAKRGSTRAPKARFHISLGQRPRNHRKYFPSAESAIQRIGYRLVCVSTCNVADSTTDHWCRSGSALRDLAPKGVLAAAGESRGMS